MRNLTCALIQWDVAWHDWQANRGIVENKLRDLKDPVDLVLLPEMFGSGFTMKPGDVAQTMDGPGVQWMLEMARRHATTLMGSLVITEDSHFYNRLITAAPDGAVSYYDKRHLFSYAEENAHYHHGMHRLIETVRDWRVCPLVCYDLRFPVWSRNNDEYDLLVYVANWPGARIAAWDVLLRARAIENLCYVIGVNRIGTDVNGHLYPGHSSVYNAAGELLYQSGAGEEVATVTLDSDALINFRKRYNFLADRDIYTVAE